MNMKDSRPIHILYIEDEISSARLFQKKMTRAGYIVDIARDGAEGLMMAKSKSYDVVAVDQKIPIHNGIEVIRELAAGGSLGPTIMVTANGDEKIAVEAMKLGASDYLIKDVDGGYLTLLPSIIERVLEKQGLIEERQEALAALEQRNRNLKRLNRVGQVLTSTLDMQQILERLLQTATEIIEAQDGSVWLWDQDVQGWLVCHAVSHHSQSRGLVNQKIAPGEGIAGWVALHGESAIVQDTTTDPRFLSMLNPQITTQIGSLLAVPLRVRARIIGVLEVVNKLNGSFNINDLTLVETLATSAAIAIDNAQLFAEVQRQAITDELTGLRNRRSFFAMSKHELERAERYGHPLSAIMLDIDHFKRVNDTYGHAVGDEVLREVANRCREETGGLDILGRYGGEEFSILLPETDLAAACQMAERLRRRVADKPIQTTQDNLSINVSISLGVASTISATPSLEKLLNRADAALYTAKEAGRNRVRANKEQPSPALRCR